MSSEVSKGSSKNDDDEFVGLRVTHHPSMMMTSVVVVKKANSPLPVYGGPPPRSMSTTSTDVDRPTKLLVIQSSIYIRLQTQS